MKKRVLRSVSIVLAILMFCFLLASCGGGTPAATQAPAAPPAGGNTPATQAPAAPQAAPDEVFECIVNLTLGEPVSPNWARLLKEVEDESGGRIKMTIYWANSLMTIPEIPKGMATGTVDFSNLPMNNFMDQMPLSSRIISLPFMGLQDPLETAEIYFQLLEEFPEMEKEYTDLNMFHLTSTPFVPYGLHFVDQKEVHLPADLRGRKIILPKLEMLDVVQNNGGAALQIFPGQVYESLEKNVADGYLNNWAFQGWFGLTELVKQHVEFGEYGMFQEFNSIVMNLDFYNKLPQDLQQLWLDKFRTDGYKYMYYDTVDLVNNQKARAAEKGDIDVNLTEEEMAIWREQAVPAHKDALDEISAQRGDDIAFKIYDRLVEIIAERYGA